MRIMHLKKLRFGGSIYILAIFISSTMALG